MKVLLCSPYLKTPDVVKGGINMWGRYVISYHQEFAPNEVDIIPVSFDRHICLSNGGVSLLTRILSGLKEQGKAVYEASRIMKSQKPDVVHICTSAGIGLLKDMLLIKLAKRIDSRIVVHLHFGRTPQLALSRNLEWKLLSKVVRSCDVAVAMNMPTKSTLEKEGFNNVKYLPNPLSIDIIKMVDSIDVHPQRLDRSLLYVGHVARTKGVYELVEACTSINNVKLRIVGKYLQEDREALEAIASQSDNGSWLTFVGEIEHSEVLKEFMSADAFVFPSYSEGFPNVILEAMACGCPIVSSDVGAIPEMLDMDNNPCGICFKPQSKDEVIKAIASVLDSPKRKHILAEKAKKRVNELYAMPKVWKQLLDIWEGR